MKFWDTDPCLASEYNTYSKKACMADFVQKMQLSSSSQLASDILPGYPDKSEQVFPDLAEQRKKKIPITDTDLFLDNFKTSILKLDGVRELPPRESLPQDTRDFLKTLEGKTKLQKIEAINDYTNKIMTFEKNNKSLADDPFRTLNDILHGARKGDCEDYAVVNAALLRYAGIPAEDIHIVMGNMSVGGDKGGHVTTIVNIDGQDYMLDPNFKDIVAMNTKNDYLGGTGHKDGNPFGYTIFLYPFLSFRMDNTNPVYTYGWTENNALAPAVPEPQAAPVQAPPPPATTTKPS